MSVTKFPVPTNGIPLVGQPFTFKAWHPTVLIVCNCEAKEPLQIVGLNTVAQCPACKRAFALGMVNYNAQTGQNNIGIALVVAPQEKEPS